PIKFIEEPIGSILFKEIILTFRSYISEEMLDPHIRFFLGCCSVFKVLRRLRQRLVYNTTASRICQHLF
ncbi:MAG: hypothetical protein J6B49_03955, partial [Phascolarctobacterium sp.]|nr:hypothetical protein [Phascolarctobacterium sp.]